MVQPFGTFSYFHLFLREKDTFYHPQRDPKLSYRLTVKIQRRSNTLETKAFVFLIFQEVRSFHGFPGVVIWPNLCGLPIVDCFLKRRAVYLLLIACSLPFVDCLLNKCFCVFKKSSFDRLGYLYYTRENARLIEKLEHTHVNSFLKFLHGA